MKSIDIDEETARAIYKVVPRELKTKLEDKFGIEVLKKEVVINDIKKFSDVLRVTGRPNVPAFSDVPEDLREYFKKTYKCLVIVEAMNKNVQVDIYNSDVKRYYPYYSTNGSSSHFDLGAVYVDHDVVNAGGGSRFSFLSSKTAKYAGKTFKDEFREMLES